MTKKKRITKLIFIILLWLMVAAEMAIILSFSGQDAVVSTQSSMTVTEKIAPIVEPEYKNMTPPQQQQIVQKLNVSVRVLAHFSEYLALGFTICAAIFVTGLNKPLIVMAISAVGGLLFAVFDECMQKFSDGRAMEFSDIVTDFCGVVLGTLICVFIRALVIIIKKHKAKKLITE